MYIYPVAQKKSSVMGPICTLHVQYTHIYDGGVHKSTRGKMANLCVSVCVCVWQPVGTNDRHGRIYGGVLGDCLYTHILHSQSVYATAYNVLYTRVCK